ncbi:MAG: hypothetical protein ACR2G0_01810 [Chthoniobacterales bacterium]
MNINSLGKYSCRSADNATFLHFLLFLLKREMSSGRIDTARLNFIFS